jgi:CRISPR-associated protein (TIGR03986 family)
VVLVTDAGARKKRKSYFCAVGRLSTDVGSQRIGLADEEVWADYLASVDETDDVRLARASGTLRPKQAVEADVTYMFADGTRMVGRRHEARPHLFEGQVLWVRVGERSTSVAGREMRVPVVTGLALSAIWRHPGVGRGGRKRGTAGQRVPPQLRPCREPDDLCPACRVFGSVDAEGAEEDQGAEQRSYRGHVRFSDAVPLGEVATRPYDLAPLGAPRPGAGQFYLRNRPGDTAARGTPLREWGSAADRAEPRRLKGRKQYWLTGRFAERPLDRVTDKPFEGKLAARAEAVVEGSVFAYRVHFEGLTVREIGGLLAALAPGEVLADQVPHDGGDTVIGIAVGGGRPFGFGACTTRITGMRIDDARSRYLATGPPDVSAAAALQAFAEAVDGGVKATWPSLAAALHLDHVDPGKVWYPPAEAIPAGPLKKQDLEPGFEFWRQTRGFEHTHGTDRLVALPDADAASQELPVKRREQRERTAPRPGRSGGRQGRRR